MVALLSFSHTHPQNKNTPRRALATQTQTQVLGCLIYAIIDNCFWPVRAKIDLREELAAALGTLGELWDRSVHIFLQRTPDPLEEAARARGLHGRLQVRGLGWVG